MQVQNLAIERHIFSNVCICGKKEIQADSFLEEIFVVAYFFDAG